MKLESRHPRPSRRPRAAGFTLIEVLTVILIIAILAAVLVTQLRDSEQASRVQTTTQLLAKLEAAIKSYENDQGSSPPSSFTSAQEVANDGDNVGIEALVVALWSKKYEAGGLLEDVRDQLINMDGDSSPKQLTDFGTRELLEIPDAFGNPLAYIERSDYGVGNRNYLTLGEEGEVRSAATAFKNPRTGQYYQAQTFQLISAGLDGAFGTEDDITTFDRD